GFESGRAGRDSRADQLGGIRRAKRKATAVIARSEATKQSRNAGRALPEASRRRRDSVTRLLRFARNDSRGLALPEASGRRRDSVTRLLRFARNDSRGFGASRRPWGRVATALRDC